MQRHVLSVRSKLAYGAGDLGFSVSYTIIGFLFLFFLTDVAGLSPALAGAAVLVGKGWDGFIDPYLGHLSDRTVSRWGRRRLFFLCGFIPYGLTFFLLWYPPATHSQAVLFLWAALVYVVHTTATSVVCVPYTCLTAELTPDYDERTTLTAYRMAFSILGGLVAAAAPMELVGAFGGGRFGFAAMGVSLGLVIMVAPLFPLIGTRETGIVSTGQVPLWRAMTLSLSNRAFQIALAVYLLTWTAMDVISAMFVYFLKYGLDMEEQSSLVLGSIFGTAALCLPLWVRVSDRWNKRVAYVVGLSLLSAVLIGVTFLTRETRVWAYPLAAIAGIGLAAAHVIPWSIVPDVIEDDELRTGRRREGDFYGLMSFAETLASSAAIAASGLVLELSGYVAGQVQQPSATRAIRFLLGPGPALLFLAGMLLLWFYPIDRTEHARIRLELERRAAREGSSR